MARKSNSHHGSIDKECSQNNTNLKVTQSIQHGIPYVVFVVLKALLRRECGRGDGPYFVKHLIKNNYKAPHLSQIGDKLSLDAELMSSIFKDCAQSAHQPSMAALHIQSLRMFCFRNVTSHY